METPPHILPAAELAFFRTALDKYDPVATDLIDPLLLTDIVVNYRAESEGATDEQIARGVCRIARNVVHESLFP